MVRGWTAGCQLDPCVACLITIRPVPYIYPSIIPFLSSENGPYSINHDMTLKETEFGWDRYHTTIFVDQPINTGFSYSNVSD